MVSLDRAWKIKHCIVNHSSCLENYMIKNCNNYSHLIITTVSHTTQNLNTHIFNSLYLSDFYWTFALKD